MDITKLSQGQYYGYRTSINDFEIEDESSLDHEIYEQLMHLKCIDPTNPSTKLLIVEIFNSVYNILSEAFLYPNPDYQLPNSIIVANENRFYLKGNIKQCIVFSIISGVLDLYKSKLDPQMLLFRDKVREHLKMINPLNKTFIVLTPKRNTPSALSPQKDQLKEKDKEIAELKKENEQLQLLLSVKEKQPYVESDIIIAEDRKIDVIKILHAMCKVGLFKKKDGTPMNIKIVMERFGKLLNNNFSGYDSNLSASKNKTKQETFLEIFDKLKEVETQYFNKS